MIDPTVPDSLTRATWWLTGATWGLVATALGGIFFTYIQLEQERRWRRGENLSRFRELFEGEIYSGVRQSLARARLAQITNSVQLSYDQVPATAWRLLDFCESMCREVDQERLSIDDVWSEFSEWIVAYSTDFEDAIEAERKRRKDKSYYSSIDSVRKQLDAYCRKIKSSPLTYNDGDIRDFYEMERDSSGA